jgi:hypothetical protein
MKSSVLFEFVRLIATSDVPALLLHLLTIFNKNLNPAAKQ